MTKTNPELSKENETKEPICLEICCRVRAYKIKNSSLKEAIERRFIISLYDCPSCSIVRYSKKKKNCDNVLF